MLASISATFGLSIDESFLSTIVGSMVAGAGGTLAGRALYQLLLIPGIGSIAGGVIAAQPRQQHSLQHLRLILLRWKCLFTR